MRKELVLALGLMIIVLIVSGCGKKAESDNCADAIDKDNCYTELAKEKMDLEVCKKIGDYAPKVQCVNDVITERFEGFDCETLDPDEARDLCFFFTGIHLRQENICDRIINLDLRDNCYYDLFNYKDCVSSATCDKVNNETIREQCKYITGARSILK